VLKFSVHGSLSIAGLERRSSPETHVAKPSRPITSMIKWIRTSRLSTKRYLFRSSDLDGRLGREGDAGWGVGARETV